MRYRGRVVRMESRGPQFPARVRLNYQLGRRLKKANPTFSIRDVEGKVASQLNSDLGKTGPPSTRTVSHWTKKQPDFPEMAVKSGVVNSKDVLPSLRRFLQTTPSRRRRHS